MKNRAMIFHRVPVKKVQYEEWKDRVRRSIRCIVKDNIKNIDYDTMEVLLYILSDIDEYYKDTYIKMINDIFNYTIKTWSENQKFLNKSKIL